jgi:hypothetical protein
MMRLILLRHILPVFGLLALCATTVRATPYASNVTKTGTTVNFILNEAADSLTYSINGGAPIPLSGIKGAKAFNLLSPTDTFSIRAERTATTGYSIWNGNLIFDAAAGLAVPSNEGGLNLISSDANPLTRYNEPRGVGVNTNPNTSNFGTVYISNGEAGLTTDSSRMLGGGLYALRADQSDAFGYGDFAQNPPTSPDGFPAFLPNDANSPYRISVGIDGRVYVSDLADANSNVFAVTADLSASDTLFLGFIGTSGNANPDGTSLMPDMNHGSVASAVTTGSLGTNNLVIYTLDEDMTTAHVTGNLGQSTTDKYSVWKYTVNGGPTPLNTMPTKVTTGITPTPLFGDMDRGADGKFYLSVNSATSPAKLVVTDAAGVPMYSSLVASQLLGSPTDMLTNLNSIAVSSDQKWLAGMLDSSDIVVIPLVDGLPKLENRLVVNSGLAASGSDITFDAANNIHFVTSGDERYRVLSPGGHTVTTLAWTGASYTFNSTIVGAGVAGDYNSNGIVDGADYVVWRNAAANATLPNDPTPGIVDASDYGTWKANFGKVGGSGTGVSEAAAPEPAGATLLVVALLAGVGWRRRAD